MIKENKAISLVSLVIVIAVIIVISSVTISISYDRFEINNLNKMLNDLEFLRNKVSNYYLIYDVLPIVRDPVNNEPIKYSYKPLEINPSANDNENYYIIDFTAMDGIAVNYGFEGFYNPNTSDDVYIINEQSNNIYYPKGIEWDGERYYSIDDNEKKISDTIPPSKPQIKIISGEQNEEGVYTTEVEIEIIPGKDSISGINKTTYSYVFYDLYNLPTTITEEIEEEKIITLKDNGEYNFCVTSIDNNNNESKIDEQININIQKQPTIKLSEMITPDNYGDLIEYEANGVIDWKVFFNDGNNVFIITSNFIPYTSLSTNSKMIRNGKYNIFWEPIYGAPAPGFEYGHAPIVSDITESSKILERAQKFKFTWLKENIDKDWNSARAVKDLLNDDIWKEFSKGLRGAEAIGAPTLEMFAESWSQKGYGQIKYTYSENGYSIGDNGSWVNLKNTNENLDTTLYLPKQLGSGADGEENICVAYWLAAIAINDTHSLLVVDGNNGGMFGDWYNAQYYGIRPVVCLPSNAVAKNIDGVWKSLVVD